MKREIIPPTGKSVVTILVPLGFKDSDQAQKLDSEPLQEKLNEIARKLKCEYAVRLNGNTATAEIAFTHQGTITDQDEHDYEVKAINFMTEVDKLELPQPAPEPECPSHENANLTEEKRETIDFVKTLLHDINLPEEDEEHVIGGQILCYGPKDIPFPPTWGKCLANS